MRKDLLILIGIFLTGQYSLASDELCKVAWENIMQKVRESGQKPKTSRYPYHKKSVQLDAGAMKTNMDLTIYSNNKDQMVSELPTYIVFTERNSDDQEILENDGVTEYAIKFGNSMEIPNVVLARPSEHMMSLEANDIVQLLNLAPEAIKTFLGLNEQSSVEFISRDPVIAEMLNIAFWDIRPAPHTIN